MNSDTENKLFKGTKKHCAAFFHAWTFGKIYFRKNNEDYILDQGTLTFVEYEGDCYAITNQHVLGENWLERWMHQSLMVALKKHLFWGIGPVYVSPPPKKQNSLYPSTFPKDIAIFPFTRNRDKLKQADKEPADLPSIMPEIKQGEILLAVGFPADERKTADEATCEHRLAHVFGTVVSLSENSIILQDNNPKKDKDISFGGMSGGPIFKIDENTGSYTLVGIIYEGKGFKRKNENDATEIGDDIWIFGSPLDGNRLKQMLDYKR